VVPLLAPPLVVAPLLAPPLVVVPLLAPPLVVAPLLAPPLVVAPLLVAAPPPWGGAPPALEVSLGSPGLLQARAMKARARPSCRFCTLV
jgi:hypothetical protein